MNWIIEQPAKCVAAVASCLALCISGCSDPARNSAIQIAAESSIAYELKSGSSLGQFGHVVVPIVDNQGVVSQSWCVVTDPLSHDASGPFVRAFTAQGATMWTFSSEELVRLGWSGVSLDDETGDGVPDCAFGAPGDANGYVVLLDGKSGTAVHRQAGAETADLFGESLAYLSTPASRVDQPRLLVGAPGSRRIDGIGSGAVYMCATSAPYTLRRFADGGPGEWFGTTVSWIADIDGDALQDVAVTTHREVVLLSQSGRRLATYSDSRGRLPALCKTSNAFDWNRDGVSDVLTTWSAPREALSCSALVRVLSSADLAVVVEFDNACGLASAISVLGGTGQETAYIAFRKQGVLAIHSNAPQAQSLEILPFPSCPHSGDVRFAGNVSGQVQLGVGMSCLEPIPSQQSTVIVVDMSAVINRAR